tara:strand:+ start:3127 stop:3618 length:492 start_codon:yes stop_codon:yes gene_type:complete
MRLSKMREPRTFKQLADHPHVSSAHTEGNDPQYGVDYWVYLEFPYISPMTETQTIHEYGMKDTLREFKNRELNYLYFLSEDWIGRRPKPPEQKQPTEGQLELPLEQIKYEDEKKEYVDKLSKIWSDCFIHSIKNDQSHIGKLLRIKNDYHRGIFPDWRNYDKY